VAHVFAQSLLGSNDGYRRIRGVPSGRARDGWWVRLNGESALGDGRWAMIKRMPTEPDSMMKLHVRWSASLSCEVAKATRAYWTPMVAASLRSGCRLRGYRNRRPAAVYADSLANLVLASYWSSALVAALSLMSVGVESLDEILLWADAAEASGQPWALDLAKLARRPDRDVMIRALRTCAQELASG